MFISRLFCKISFTNLKQLSYNLLVKVTLLVAHAKIVITVRIEQLINVKYLVKLGKSATECYETAKCLRRKRILQTNALEVLELWLWTPILKVTEIVQNGHQLGIRAIAELINIEKFNPKKCAKTVLKFLLEQKERCVDISANIHQCIKNCPDFLRKVITCEETWIFQYNPKAKWKSIHWKSPDLSKFKVMLIVFFNIWGITYSHWIPAGQTINQYYYLEVLKSLWTDLEKNDLWKENLWILHQDDTPAHNALSVYQFLAKNHMTLLEHPLYLLKLTPCNFFLFPKIKSVLKGTCFEFIEVIKDETAQLLKNLKHCVSSLSLKITNISKTKKPIKKGPIKLFHTMENSVAAVYRL